MEDEYMIIEVTNVVADYGTIVVFAGIDGEGRWVTFGVDHREAQDIADILYADGPFPVAVEGWQIHSTEIKEITL